MKKILFFLLGVMLIAVSCSKEKSQEEETDNTYFIRFKAGTETKEYKNVVLAMRSTAGGLNTVSIQGRVDLTGNKESILVAISEPEPVAEGIYSERTDSDSPALLLTDTTGKQYSTLFMTNSSGVEVKVTNLNNSTIRGTFSGRTADLDGNELEITEGSFYAKFQ